MNDAEVVTASINKLVPLDQALNPTNVGVDQSLQDFFAKPVILQQGVLSSGDTATSLPVGDIFYSGLLLEPFYSKTRGFIGFTGTAVLTLQINGNPFQQGRYILGYVPYGGCDATGGSSADWFNMHRYSLVQCSQVPHIELDIACDTEGVLRVPFISAEPVFPLRNLTTGITTGEVGAYFLRPYASVLNGPGSATVPYTLFIHFENVNLTGPAIPQSGWKPDRGGTVTTREQKAAKAGPIETGLLAASKVSNILMRVPVLSEFANIASWALDISANVASVFGFAKPNTIAPVSRMVRPIFADSHNTAGISAAQPLAFTQTNELEVLPGFAGTDIDEMSIDYMKSIPSYFNLFVWNTSQVAGTQLFSYALQPYLFYIDSFDSTNSVRSFTPLAILAHLFGYWRGGITFKFKMAKTTFHSGRLMFVFTPYTQANTTATPSFANSPYALRTIIDVREGNVFEITCPYGTTSPYLPCDVGSGTLTCYILDPLVAPASVSSTFTTLVEVSGAPDFEVAAINNFQFSPYIPASPQSGWKPDPCSLVTEVIGGSTVDATDVFARACIGERILSLKSLINFNQYIGYFDPTPAQAAVNYFEFGPWAVALNRFSAPIARPVNRVDLLGVFSTFFTLCRGGVRLSVILPTDSIVQTRVHYANNETTKPVFTSAVAGANYPTSWVMAPVNIQSSKQMGGVELQVPFYSRFKSLPCSDMIWYAAKANLFSHLPNYRIDAYAQNAGIAYPYRAASDDFMFGGFISIPPMSAYY